MKRADQTTADAEASPGADVAEPPAALPSPADETPLTATELEELRAKAAKAEEHWDRLLRQAADFENFKKRAARERQDAIRFANEGLISKLIPMLDNFEMALTATAQAGGTHTDSLRVGVEMILNQLKATLVEMGLEEIEAAGKPFDPNWHEAISQQDSTEVTDGTVLQQVRRGYKLRDRLLRPATVILARKPTTNE